MYPGYISPTLGSLGLEWVEPSSAAVWFGVQSTWVEPTKEYLCLMRVQLIPPNRRTAQTEMQREKQAVGEAIGGRLRVVGEAAARVGGGSVRMHQASAWWTIRQAATRLWKPQDSKQRACEEPHVCRKEEEGERGCQMSPTCQ
jgi:hypothetical protein